MEKGDNQEEDESKSEDDVDQKKESEGPEKKVDEKEEVDKDKLICEYQDRLLRAQADFQNYQKRVEREFADYRAYANSKLLEDILVIVDDFQNALDSASEGEDKEFIRGFEMIYNNLLEVLKKEGLSEIPAVNEKFDPFKHEAVDMVPTDEHPEHTVIGVVQKGYTFKDKVLRPARVQVTTQPKENV
jgi:molecular chaperone GrpE